MPLYGGSRDQSFKRRVNRSFMNRTVGQEVLYYKLSLKDTVVNIYGESKNKMYYQPILVTCRIDRQPQTADEADYGPTTERVVDFNFLRDDLIQINLVPEKGDIILWDEAYYEVNNTIEDQLLVGKDPDHSLQSGMEKFGNSLSIICKSQLTRVNKLNLVKVR
jgi:hypothetical protein